MNKLNRLLGYILMIFLSQTIIINAQEHINLLTFNVWQEGTKVDEGLTKICDVIIEANPDIVCFSEVRNYKDEDWTTKIIEALSAAGQVYHGKFAGGDVSLISKFPIASAEVIYGGDESVVKFEVQLPNQLITVVGAHLDYKHYACYLPRGYSGGTPDWKLINDGNGNPKPVLDVSQILTYNLDSSRDEQIAALLNAVNNQSNPVILMGDFNEPSHLDWTAKTAPLFDHNGLSIPWNNSITLAENGFVDAYRTYFPDEAANPGFTWPSEAYGVATTSWTLLVDERDRIDFIYYKGEGISTTYAALVGPRASYVNNELNSTQTNNENFIADKLDWPSDHKAVFVTLKIPHKKKISETPINR